ncbi:transposase [Bradyrhizobium sp. DN5]|uniref:transposase n=1 Tax=Bradyrhizobium sp. DN5 TaxID=3056950 RepID=UPI0035245051
MHQCPCPAHGPAPTIQDQGPHPSTVVCGRSCASSSCTPRCRSRHEEEPAPAGAHNAPQHRPSIGRFAQIAVVRRRLNPTLRSPPSSPSNLKFSGQEQNHSHPLTIAIVARTAAGGYGQAAAKALPHAVQVADRWHPMENASRALDAVRKWMRQIRSAIGAMAIVSNFSPRPSAYV